VKTNLILFLVFLVLPARAAAGASLSFFPPKLDLQVGQQSLIGIILNPTGQQVIGVDLLLHFDPDILQIDQAEDTQVFNRQTALIVDNQAGTIKWALSNNYQIFTTHSAEIARIRLTARKATTNSSIGFDFQAGRTQDTNVAAAHGQDILSQADDLQLTIATLSLATPSSPPIRQTLGAQTVVNQTPTWPIYVLLGAVCLASGTLLLITYGRLISYTNPNSQ